MKIEINNCQKICRPDITRIKKLAHKLMDKAARLDPGIEWGELSIVLTDDHCIRELKTQLFDRREVTDVISLRYDAVPGENGILTGEIFLNVQRALHRSNKPQPGREASRELALYLAHGCDHLMNSTDYDMKGYRRMRRRELNWLKSGEIARLAATLFSPVQTRKRQ